MNESMFSAIDQIRQDSKDVRDFVKKVFADREFKKMSNDKEFIKYLKSIYEGTMIDEEHVKFSNRTQNGTITTGSVQITNESVNEANSRDEYDAKEFWGVSKMGIQLHKQFKGRFNKSKFEKALGDLIGKSKRPESTIKIIGRYLNIEPRKLNSYTSGEIIEDQEFIKDSTKKAEQLYKIFVSSNESVNESKYSIIDPRGNAAGTGTKDQVNRKAKTLGGSKKGYFVVPVDRAKEARRAMERFKFNFKNPKLQDKMSGLYFDDEMFGESVNEASKLAMGIAGFTGTRGSAVDAFIDSHKIDAKKLFNFVKKGNLKDRMAFVSAIAGKPNNKMFKMITKQFSESTPQGYNPMVEDKSEIKGLVKKVGNKETKFYDVLSTMEKKYGKNKYRIWLEKSLKDFGVNPKHYDYRTNGAAEEKLFQLGKK